MCNQDSIVYVGKTLRIWSISHGKEPCWISLCMFEVQHGYVITSADDQLAKWPCCDISTQSADKGESTRKCKNDSRNGYYKRFEEHLKNLKCSPDEHD